MQAGGGVKNSGPGCEISKGNEHEAVQIHYRAHYMIRVYDKVVCVGKQPITKDTQDTVTVV